MTGFIQLICSGSEQSFLNNDAQIDFFHIIYRRYSNFFINTIVDNNTNINYNENKITNFIVPHSGDLLSESYICLESQENYIELFDDKKTKNTIETNILNFYDNYTTKIFDFNKQMIHKIDILKLFLSPYLTIEYINLSNIMKYKELINWIVFNPSIKLQTDENNIFYNLNKLYNFYSFETSNIEPNEILNTYYLTLLFNSIQYEKINYIRIDLQYLNLSLKIIANINKYKDIINLFLNNQNNNNENRLKISEYELYLFTNNSELTNILFQNIFNSINDVNVFYNYKKKFNKTKTNIEKKELKNILLQDKNFYKYYIVNLNENIIFKYNHDNFNNNDFNESLIQNETILTNTFNLNNQNNLSSITLLRIFVYIFNNEEISLENFINTINNNQNINITNLNFINKKYSNNYNFYEKIIQLLFDNNVLLASNDFYSSVNYQFETNKNYFINFINKKINNYNGIIINKFLTKNNFNSINNKNVKINNISNKLINSILIFSSNTKLNVINYFINLLVNYDNNNFLFEINSNDETFYYNKLLENFKNDNFENIMYYYQYSVEFYKLTSISINLLKYVYNKKSNFIYQKTGKTTIEINDYPFSLFPLTSSLYSNFSNYFNKNLKTFINEINTKIYEIYITNYFKFQNIINNEIIEKNQFIEKNKLLISELTSSIYQYYEKRIDILKLLKISDMEYYTDNLHFYNCYEIYNENYNDIILNNIFSKINKEIFNESFNDINIYKFYFSIGSPLYKLLYLFNFLCVMTEDKQLINIMPFDLNTLRNFVLYFILIYFDLSLPFGITNIEYDFMNLNFNDIFICYDEINIFEFIDNEKISIYSPFYFLKSHSNFNSNNFDSFFIMEFEKFLIKYKNDFINIDSILIFVKEYFNKKSNNFTNIVDKLNFIIKEPKQYENIDNLIYHPIVFNENKIYDNNYQTTYSIGILFDNINLLNIVTINELYNQIKKSKMELNDIYTVINFNIKQNKNFIETDNIINYFEYSLTLIYNISNSNLDIFDNYIQFINGYKKYWKDNIVYLKNYLINKIVFVHSYNTLIQYYKITKNEKLINYLNEINFEIPLFEIIYLLLLNFFEINLHYDINIFLNNLNKYENFNDYLISTYNENIYEQLLKKLLFNYNNQTNVNNLNYGIINFDNNYGQIEFYNWLDLNINDVLNQYNDLIYSYINTTSNIKNINFEIIDNETTITQSFEKSIDYIYFETIDLLKNMYENLNDKYLNEKYENYEKNIIDNLFLIIQNFSFNNNNNYFKNLFYLPSQNNEMIKKHSVLFFNSQIINSFQFETELNRYLYYYMTKYVFPTLDEGNIHYLKNHSLYEIVKMYKITKKNYEKNLYITQNNLAFELLNVNIFNDTHSPTVHSLFVDLIVSYDNFFIEYDIFYNKCIEYDENIFNSLLLSNGLNAGYYFTELSNVNELNDYINNFILSNENFSPFTIFDQIIEFQNHFYEINCHYNIDKNNIMKKMIVYLFMIFLIYNKLPQFIIENLNLRKEYYLEYFFPNTNISFQIKDALNVYILYDLEKFIYTYYKNKLNLTVPIEYSQPYNDDFIIQIINNNLNDKSNFYEFCFEYISVYKKNIGYENIETTKTNNLFSMNENFTISNIIKNINITYNIDQIEENNKKYELTNYTVDVLNIYYKNDIIDINDNLNNQMIKSIHYENMKKNYKNSNIKNINILFTLINYLLFYYGIKIENQLSLIENIINNLEFNENFINEYKERIDGNITKKNLFDDMFGFDINSRSSIILKLSKMTYKYDNLGMCLITPLDYDNDIVFNNINVINKNGISIYKKYFDNQYNFYQWKNSETSIYIKKIEYYEKILTKNKILFNLKKNDDTLYVKTFIDIFYSFISKKYYLNNENYPDIIKECLKIYLKYNSLSLFSNDKLIKNISDYEEIEKIIKIILNNKKISLEELSDLITEIYFYKLFEKKINDVDKNKVENDFILFFKNLNIENNYFFEYNQSLYNYINKMKILKMDVNEIENQKEQLLNINNIYYFFNEQNIKNMNNTQYIYYKFIQTLDLFDLLKRFQKSVDELIYYYLDNSINYQLSYVYEKYFKNKKFKYFNYIYNSNQYSHYELTFKEFVYYTYYYIQSIVNNFDDNLIKNSFYGISKNFFNNIYLNDNLEKQILFMNNYWKISSLNKNIDLKDNKSLYILYVLKILLLMIKNQNNFKNNFDVVLNYGNKYIINEIEFYCLNISNGIPTCFDYINENYVKNNELNNYFKKIMNNVIKLNIKYKIFENKENYQNKTIQKIFNLLINKPCNNSENVMTLNMLPNVISNLINENNEIIEYNDQNNLDYIMKKIMEGINNNFNNFIEILGGYKNNIYSNYSITTSQLNTYYNDEKMMVNDVYTTIFTLLYSNFENFNMNTLNLLIIPIFFYLMLVMIYVMVYGDKYIYNLNKIIKYLIGIICEKVKENDVLFIDKLNKLFIKQYTNENIILLSKEFFENILMKETNFIEEEYILNGQNESNYRSRIKNNEIQLNKEYYENKVIGKYVYNSKLNVWKDMLIIIVDGNDSNIINNMKSISIDNLNLINIPKEYVGFIEKNKNLTSLYGILNIMEKIEMTIDTQLIDYFTRNYYEVIYDLTNINKLDTVKQFYGIDGNNVINTELSYIKKMKKRFYYIPLYFFIKDRNNALPLIACMYPVIQFRLYTNTNTIIDNYYKTKLLTENNSMFKTSISYDFILIEREERKKITENINDNLIEKHNYYELSKSIKNFNRSFNDNVITLMFEFELNNSVKELFWLLNLFVNDYSLPNVLKSNSDTNFVLSTLFYIDGIKRDGIRPFINYTTKEQATLNNSSQIQYGEFDIVNRYLNTYKYNTRSEPSFPYYSYSFALCPESFQPTGSYNMSNTKRFGIQLIISKEKLLKYIQGYGNLDKLSINMKLYTLEYNILRFQSGLAGLLFKQ